nr:DUF4184 family protein [Kibdelosporangium phytohabitans]
MWFPALAVGVMAPDLAYYVPIPLDTHSLVGIATVDILIGLAATHVLWEACTHGFVVRNWSSTRIPTVGPHGCTTCPGTSRLPAGC